VFYRAGNRTILLALSTMTDGSSRRPAPVGRSQQLHDAEGWLSSPRRLPAPTRLRMPLRDVRFRLLRADDRPASNPDGRGFVFGLQDTKCEIVAGTRGADGGFVFEFALTVKRAPADGRPVFTGRFASGPAADRFVYLAWRAEAGAYINRVKARLGTIDWPLIEAAEASGGRVTARPHGVDAGGRRKFVGWGE
jgi:hypothetical protein